MAALASDRLIVPISSKDKKRIEQLAKRGRISTAEFVRRAALHYDPGKEREREEAELKLLLEVFHSTHRDTVEQLDATDRALDRALAHFEAKSGA